MDIAIRLNLIEQEVRWKTRSSNGSKRWVRSGPAIDPILIRDRMLFLQNEIRSLENRKRALLEEQQELIVRAVTRGD